MSDPIPMKHAVSVIYVNYNTSDLLIKSIRSLEEHCNSIPFEVIIIDNASSPAEQSIIAEWVKQCGGEKIRVVFSSDNLGFARANNLGASLSQAQYLFFLNPDTILLNNVLQVFYGFMESSAPDIVACGGNLLNGDLTPNSSYGNFPGLLLELCNVGLGLSTLLNRYYTKGIAISCTVSGEAKVMVPYIVGAAIFLRSKEFKSIGGFDENYFMYYEETDLFLRLKKKNLQSYILPQANIIHYEGASVGKSKMEFNYKKFEMLLNSKLYYYSKWLPNSMVLVKMLVLMQISVQYLKGKWGPDFGRLMSIYRRSIKPTLSNTRISR